MTAWQKVRVEFDDADGNRVSAVMWRDGSNQAAWARSDDIPRTSVVVDWVKDDDVTVTPIRELPTGLGAVIEVPTVPGYCERWVRVGDDSWRLGSYVEELNSYFDGLAFTVLSEGVQ